MIWGHSHHDARNLGHPTDGGWANTHLGYEAAMTTIVAMCVILTGAVLFMPVWLR